jgi:hypothetical protein
MRKPAKDMTGEIHGRLTVIKRDGFLYGREIAWECACVCGKILRASGFKMRKGITRSCGCLAKELRAKVPRRHSVCPKCKTRERESPGRPCQECTIEYLREYHARKKFNPKYRRIREEWATRNREQVLDRHKEYYKENKARMLAKNKEYRENNKPWLKLNKKWDKTKEAHEYRKEYRKSNRDMFNSANRKYRSKHKERLNAESRQRYKERKYWMNIDARKRYESNPEVRKNTNRRWVEKNIDKVREKARARGKDENLKLSDGIMRSRIRQVYGDIIIGRDLIEMARERALANRALRKYSNISAKPKGVSLGQI